jgi:hypothetical protein
MDANAALLLDFLCEKHGYHKNRGELTEKGAFVCMAKEVDECLFFKRRVQETSFKALSDLGILITKVVGLPAKRHIIFCENAAEVITDLVGEPTEKSQIHYKNKRNRVDICKTRHIYFLFQDSELVYIGKSENIKSRLYNHLKSNKEFDRFAYMEFNATDDILTEIEGAYIKKYKPKHNLFLAMSADTHLAVTCPYTLPKHPLTEIKNLP